MSYKTVEVELDNGRVRPLQGEALPAAARALLTVLEPREPSPGIAHEQSDAGLKRFLSAPDFPLTPEQWRASMEADFFDQ